jgi:hypothetical protein
MITIDSIIIGHASIVYQFNMGGVETTRFEKAVSMVDPDYLDKANQVLELVFNNSTIHCLN